MIKPIETYGVIAFDCDGVLLNSNEVKTRAFYETVLPFGKDVAEKFIAYHTQNGGISRYKKFAYFLEKLAPNHKKASLDELLLTYAEKVVDGLLSCEIAEGLDKLAEKTTSSKWLVASGGDQNELRTVFKTRGLSHFFDLGVHGSPSTKEEIFQKHIVNSYPSSSVIFLGDSKYDFEASQKFNFDFLFISGWSEVSDKNAWCQTNDIVAVDSLMDLLKND